MFIESVGVTSSRLETPLAFVEDGVKINHHVYLNVLKDIVVPWMNCLILINGLTVHQDAATPHTAFDTVPHTLLIQKLFNAYIDTHTKKWFANYSPWTIY